MSGVILGERLARAVRRVEEWRLLGELVREGRVVVGRYDLGLVLVGERSDLGLALEYALRLWPRSLPGCE